MEFEGLMKGLDYVAIAAYVVIVLGIGFWVSYKRRGEEDLFLAGRQLKWYQIGLSMFAANVSPSFMIIACSVAYTVGIAQADFEWLAWPFIVLMSMVFVPYYIKTKITTMPEFMSRRYNESCRNFLSFYTMFAMPVRNALVFFASSLLLSQIVGCPFWVSLVSLMVISVSFTVTGGLAAVVATNVFQSILIIVVSGILTIIGLFKAGGFSNLVSMTPASHWDLFRPASSELYPWPAVLLGFSVTSIYFWCAGPEYGTAGYQCQESQTRPASALFAGFLKILTPLIFVTPGLICRGLFPDLQEPEAAYTTLVAAFLPVGMVGLVVAMLVAAMVSTVNSGFNAVSTIFTMDVYHKWIRPNASADELKFVGRCGIVATALIGTSFAFAISQIKYDGNIFILLHSIMSFISPSSLSAVFVVGIVWKRATPKAAIYTLMIGNIISIALGVCYIMRWPYDGFWPHFLYMAFFIFTGDCIFMAIVSLLDKPPSAEKQLPSLASTYETTIGTKRTWLIWGLLAVIMLSIYVYFQWFVGR